MISIQSVQKIKFPDSEKAEPTSSYFVDSEVGGVGDEGVEQETSCTSGACALFEPRLL
jgi:hypothetical protein